MSRQINFLFVCPLIYVLAVSALPSELRVGGLFDPGDVSLEVAFNITAQIINEDQTFLKDVQLFAQIENVPPFDSLRVSEKVCELLAMGIVGIFGPQSDDTTDHVQSMCDTMEIPHLEYRWNSRQRRGSCLVNLFPYPAVLSKVYSAIVEEWQWKRFTIIYAENEGLVRTNEIIKHYTTRPYKVVVRQLDDSGDHRDLFLKMKRNGEKNIVLDCPAKILHEVLIQAQQVGIMGEDVSYIITTLDINSVDLEPFKYGGTNITGVRLVNPENENVVKFAEEWKKYSEANPDLELMEITPDSINVEIALLHDALLLFAKSLYYLDNSTEIQMKSLNCDTNSNWEHGYSVINYMKMSEINGMTGIIKFDHEGFRSNFMLDIVELTNTDGLRKKGTWNSSEGLNWALLPPGEPEEGEVFSLQNKTFIVMIALTHPYGMLKEDKKSLRGNDRFEGMGIDIIHELSLMNGFNYTFRVQEDKSSGNPNNVTGKWNGMLGEVLEDRAQLAIADITITREREKDVDFTSPFMNLGISILYKKPQKTPPSMFSFLSPFSAEVWWYVIAAFLGVSLLLFIEARICPSEWTNPYPCIDEPESLENQFSFANSVWFALGAVLQQGSEIAPIAISTRMAASMWWFFTLIMVSSYTANLAAFLTIEGRSADFRSIEDLANQNPHTIKYGAKKGGATANFFRDSNSTLHQKIWQYMDEHPDVMTSSNEEGVARVLNEKYAFFMESTSISYEVERKCDLTQVGSLLDNKGYGIAMKKNSPYRDALSTSVLRLQEKGRLSQLTNKWWKEKRGGGACNDDQSDGGSADELGLDHVGGIFVVLVCGSSLACLITLFEVVWEICNKKDKISFKDEIMEEIKFIMRCKGATKPLRRGKSEAGDPFEENSTSSHGFELNSVRKDPLE